MAYPERHRHFRVDSFSCGDIGFGMDLMLPLFREILENTTSSCTNSAHALMMDIVRNIIGDIQDAVTSIKASDPDMHGGLEF